MVFKELAIFQPISQSVYFENGAKWGHSYCGTLIETHRRTWYVESHDISDLDWPLIKLIAATESFLIGKIPKNAAVVACWTPLRPQPTQASWKLVTSWKLVGNWFATSSRPGFPTSFQLVRLCGLRPLQHRKLCLTYHIYSRRIGFDSKVYSRLIVAVSSERIAT